jgi:hypothetical protein
MAKTLRRIDKCDEALRSNVEESIVKIRQYKLIINTLANQLYCLNATDTYMVEHDFS